MAETATAQAPTKFVSETVFDLIDDPEFPTWPVHKRLDKLSELGKKDPGWRSTPKPVQDAYLKKLFGLTPTTPATSPTTTTPPTSAPSATPPTSATSATPPTTAPSTPPTPTPTTPEPPRATPWVGLGETPMRQRAGELVQDTGEAFIAAGKGAIQGVDSLLGLLPRAVGAAIEVPGMLPEALGVLGPGQENPFTRAGQFVQSRPFTHPLESLVTGGSAFAPPTRPEHALLEHAMEVAVGAGAGATVLAKVAPLLQEGVPLTEQVLFAVKAALKGDVASQAAGAMGANPWVQVGANLVFGSGLSKDTVVRAFTTLKDKLSLRTHIAGMTQKIQEAFGGPTLVEQRTGGGAAVEAVQTRALEDIVTTAKQPVEAARLATAARTAERETAQAEQRAATAQNVLDLRGAQDQHTQQIVRAEMDLHAAQDAARTATRDTADAARQARYQAEDTYRATVHAAEDTQRLAMTEARTRNTQLGEQLRAQQQELETVSAQIAKDNDTALAWAEASAKRAAPAMAEAGRKASEAGRGMIRGGGSAAAVYTEGAYQRFKTYFKGAYKDLYDTYKVTGDGNALVDSLHEFENKLIGQARESYVPDPIFANIRDMVAKNPKGRGGEGVVDLEGIHDIGSMVLDQIRHTPQGSARAGILKYTLGIVNEFKDAVSEKFPDAMERLALVNGEYRRQVRPFYSGPGEAILKVNPVTGDPMKSPVEIGHMLFAPGPGVATSSATTEANLRTFVTFMDDARVAHRAALMRNDYAAAHEAQNAIDGVTRIAKAKFYDAVMGSGSYDVAAAEKWLKTYDTQIKASPELTKIFRTHRDRTEAIREVEASGHQLLADEQDYLRQLQKAREEVTAEGGAALAEARAHVQGERRQAGEERLQERRDIGEQTEAARRLTQDEQTRAARQRGAEARQAALDKRQAERQAKDIRDVHTERVRVAREAEKEAQAFEATAVAEFKAKFGGVGAAKEVLDDTASLQVLGSRASDIVAEIEAKPLEAQNRAYARWFQLAGTDATARRALLAAKMRTFLGIDRTTPVTPGQLVTFIDNQKPFLQTYYPHYLENIQGVQAGLARADALLRSRDLSGFNIFSHSGPTGVAIAASMALGYNYHAGIAAGGTIELLRAGRHLRQVAGLQEVYMNPTTAAQLREAMRSGSKARVGTTVSNILARSGLLFETASGENARP